MKNFYKRIVNRMNKRGTSVLVSLCICIQILSGSGVLFVHAENQISETVLETGKETKQIQEPEGLYAQSAVLMDGDSGRVLFEKNGQEERAMASTTKIMTCILALESGKIDEIVETSANAASQPEVRLGVREGQQFYIRDLLYSLMLESHNDSAVMIAEAIGGTVEGFADFMNEKAKELKCTHTYFITPNGLDEKDSTGFHHTTAEDLARMMKYCIMDSAKKSLFLEITRTREYEFSDVSGETKYACINHNAFLNMMEGALSGKTGFTAEAGYCYVGALESQGRTFVVALLACGWPNHKGYKWSDTKKLMNYGMDHFHYQNLYQKIRFPSIEVVDGIPGGNALSGKSYVEVVPKLPQELKERKNELNLRVLLRDDEQITMEQSLKKKVEAPMEKGTEVGRVHILLGGRELYTYSVVTAERIGKRDLLWCVLQLWNCFLVK